MTVDPPAADPWAGAPVDPPPFGPTGGGDDAAPRRRTSVLVAGVAAVVAASALVGGLTYLWSQGGESARACSRGDVLYQAELARGGYDTWCMRVEPGEALRFRITPADGQDVMVAFAFDESFLGDPFFGGAGLTDVSQSEIEAAFFGGLAVPADGEVALAGLIDERGPGDPESDVFPPLPVPADLLLLVAGFEGAAGSYTIEVEVLPAADDFDREAWENFDDYRARFFASDLYTDYYASFFEGEFFEP